MATTQELIEQGLALLQQLDKKCGGKGKEKDGKGRRKVASITTGRFPSLKVNDPEFILRRLLAGESAGFFSKTRLIAKIGEEQVLIVNDGIPMAWGLVRQGGPVSTADAEKFAENVRDGVDPATRADFHDVDNFYYIPLQLSVEFPEPVILKALGTTVDFEKDIAKSMVDPRSFAENPSIIELGSTPNEELLLIRGGLIDLIENVAGNEELLGKVQQAHTIVADELKLRGIMHDRGSAEKAEWSRAFINDLPDSSFLIIDSGGKKDSEGKTVPRSLRHFPVKGPDGKADLPHIRNALARIPQSNLSAEDKARAKSKAERMLAEAQKDAVGKCGVREREVRIFKATDEVEEAKEERFIFGVVLVPNEPDSQGDIYSTEEVRKAAHAYMESSNGTFKLMHAGDPIEGLKILETYVTKAEETHGGETFPLGTWLMGARVLDNTLWDSIKKGVFTGFSIGGSALRERLQ